jgi:hypothetical protein
MSRKSTSKKAAASGSKAAAAGSKAAAAGSKGAASRVNSTAETSAVLGDIGVDADIYTVRRVSDGKAHPVFGHMSVVTAEDTDAFLRDPSKLFWGFAAGFGWYAAKFLKRTKAGIRLRWLHTFPLEQETTLGLANVRYHATTANLFEGVGVEFEMDGKTDAHLGIVKNSSGRVWNIYRLGVLPSMNPYVKVPIEDMFVPDEPVFRLVEHNTYVPKGWLKFKAADLDRVQGARAQDRARDTGARAKAGAGASAKASAGAGSGAKASTKASAKAGAGAGAKAGAGAAASHGGGKSVHVGHMITVGKAPRIIRAHATPLRKHSAKNIHMRATAAPRVATEINHISSSSHSPRSAARHGASNLMALAQLSSRANARAHARARQTDMYRDMDGILDGASSLMALGRRRTTTMSGGQKSRHPSRNSHTGRNSLKGHNSPKSRNLPQSHQRSRRK